MTKLTQTRLSCSHTSLIDEFFRHLWHIILRFCVCHLYVYVGNMIVLGRACQVSNCIIVLMAMQNNLSMLILGVAPSIYRDTDDISHWTDILVVAISILSYWISGSMIQNHKIVTLSMTHWFDSYLIFWGHMYKITQKLDKPSTAPWCFLKISNYRYTCFKWHSYQFP